MTIALALEVSMVAAAALIYWFFIPGLTRSNRIGVMVLLVCMSIVTVMGQAFSTQAPAPTMAAASWVIEVPVLSTIAFWLDRKIISPIKIEKRITAE
jgi:hypothetical protein